MLSLIILSFLIITVFIIDGKIIPYIQNKIEKRSEVIKIFENFLKSIDKYFINWYNIQAFNLNEKFGGCGLAG